MGAGKLSDSVDSKLSRASIILRNLQFPRAVRLDSLLPLSKIFCKWIRSPTKSTESRSKFYTNQEMNSFKRLILDIPVRKAVGRPRHQVELAMDPNLIVLFPIVCQSYIYIFQKSSEKTILFIIILSALLLLATPL